jgi:putative nucleotidyltransferase with HDIG domain
LRLGDVIVDCLAEQRHLATDIYSVLHHDYSTFTHSTNVAFYAVLLARELGISRQDYRRIAIGGLLHDIGKRHLQSNLINKPGGLTRQEYVEVQLHPRLGFEELATRSELNYGQLMMVYQHHERIDGSGYPTRVSGSEIHLWARLCSVVDAFEALTSDRPYRRSTSPQAAIEIMRRGAGTALDAELLTCWEGLVAGKLEQRR